MAYGKVSNEVRNMIRVKINGLTDTVERVYRCRLDTIRALDSKFEKSFEQEIFAIAKEKLATCYPEKKIKVMDWNFRCQLSASETYRLLESILNSFYGFKKDLEIKIIGQLELTPNDKREEKLEELLIVAMDEFNNKYSIKKLEEILSAEKDNL